MDSLVQLALAGTARMPEADAVTSLPVGRLVAGVGEASRERRLLLLAGALATYRLAGHPAAASTSAVAACPSEAQPMCSPGATALLRMVFDGPYAYLLPEALARLRAVGQVLSPELLPVALEQRGQERREAVSHVLGARGRWLASHNPAWSWATAALDDEEGVPLDAQAIWEEGEAAQRLEMFRRVRAADPARAREWLQAAWKQEKADMRVKLLAALEQHLGPEDEPLLEAALDDRSANVRTAAAGHLARLAASAFVGRILARADGLLEVAHGKLEVTPPQAWDPSWSRDGLTPKPALTGFGERAWWLAQLLSFVSPVHWEERFGLAPSALISAATASAWAPSLLQGWSQAALLHADTGWICALWDWWFQLTPTTNSRKAKQETERLLTAVSPEELFAHLPAAEAERRALPLLADPDLGNAELHEIVNALPLPWSQPFGDAYLQGVRSHVARVSGRRAADDPWLYTLGRAAVALPVGCFAAALRPWELPEDGAPPARAHWHEELERFTSTLRMRQRLVEEMHA